MYCGLNATVKDYFSIVDFTVEYEDGVLVEHISYGQFTKGIIPHEMDLTSAESKATLE